MPSRRLFLLATAFDLLFAPGIFSQTTGLPQRMIVGYWHNFDNGSGLLRLSDVPAAYDVVDVAFADPGAGSAMTFVPLPSIYSSNRQFTLDIGYLHSKGKKVLLSIGGANAVIQLKTGSDIHNFDSSLTAIINTFGFDGVDLDLEGSSLVLDTGDKDFRAPTTATIKNLIQAIQGLLANFPGGIILSAAPETAFVQGGYVAYAGIYGAFLPVIYALKDQFTYIHVQDYNTGSMYGRDGVIYQPGTPDFLVAMADMLIAGFTVDAFKSKIPFPGLGADKVLIGLPATTDAASSGFMQFPEVRLALNYLYNGASFGGAYQLSSPFGYHNFRGVMTWSINWDAYAHLAWSTDYREYLDTLVTSVADQSTPEQIPGGFLLGQNYPNPFNPSTILEYTISGVRGQASRVSDVRIVIYDLLGREVATLVDARQAPGTYEVRFDGSGLASGVYFYRLTAGNYSATKTMVLEK